MNCYEEFALYYDELMDDVDYEGWFLYIKDIFTRSDIEPKEVLEMACGTGNLTYYLCKEGYNVTSFDMSEEMLSIAYNKLLHFKNLKLLKQNMNDFKMSKRFDSIVSICDSINYILNKDELLKIFKNVYEHLKEDGLFIFDINSYYKLSEIIGDNTFVEDRDDIYYVWQNYFDKASSLAQFNLDFFIKDEDGSYMRFDEEHIERAYQIEEIESILKEAGFKGIKKYEAFTFNTPKNNSERINFVAKK